MPRLFSQIDASLQDRGPDSRKVVPKGRLLGSPQSADKESIENDANAVPKGVGSGTPERTANAGSFRQCRLRWKESEDV